MRKNSLALKNQSVNNQNFVVFILCSVIFLDSFSFFLTLPILLKIIFESKNTFFHAHHTYSFFDKSLLFGLLLGVTPLINMFLSIFIGGSSDYFGRKKLLLVTLSLSFLSYVVLLWGISAQSFILIFWAKILSGIGGKSQPVAEAAITDIYKGKVRSHKISLIACAMVLAMTIGPIIGAYCSDPSILPVFNLSFPVYIGLGITAIATMLTWFFYGDSNKSLIYEKSPVQLKIFHKFPTKVILYFIVFFLMQSSWAMFYQYMPVYFIHAWSNSIKLSSLYLTVLGFIMAFGLVFVYYWLINYFTLIRITAVCFLVAFIASMLFLIFNTITWFYILGGIYALVIGLYYPALVTLMSHELEQSKQGLLMGYNTMLMALAWFTTSFLFGILSKYSAQYPFVYQLIFILIATGVFFYVQVNQAVNKNKVSKQVI